MKLASAVAILVLVGVIWELFTARPQPVASLPRAEVRTVERDDYILEVINHGPPAVFHANVRVLKSTAIHRDKASHRLWWERAKATESRIVTGAQDEVRFARFRYPRKAVDPAEVWFIWFDEQMGRNEAQWNAPWIPPGLFDEQRRDAVIEVTISSEPEMQGGPLVFRYRLLSGFSRELIDRGLVVPVTDDPRLEDLNFPFPRDVRNK